MIQTRPEDVLRCPALLTPFNLLCYANLKKYTFDHQLSFPTLPSKGTTTTASRQVDSTLLKEVEEYIARESAEQRGFFVAYGSVEGGWKVDTLANLLSISNDTVLPLFHDESNHS
jgi:Ubiquitin-like modifier-activating enzyme ATG7 N-terminus